MLKMLTEEEYAKRASKAGRVAVFREYMADRETPVAALSRIEEGEQAFLLESVAHGETRGRYSYLGIEPQARIEGADALERLRALQFNRYPDPLANELRDAIAQANGLARKHG